MRLFSMPGDLVLEKPLDGTTRISLEALHSGTYIYTINDRKGINILSHRIVIMK